MAIPMLIVMSESCQKTRFDTERGLPFMTSALEGGSHGKADECNRGCMEVTVTGGGGGGKKIREFCGRHIWKVPKEE